MSETLPSIGPRRRSRWRRLQPQDSLARDRWWLSVQLSVILTLGFGAVALFTYANALTAARRQVMESTLPLTLDALSADLQQDFVQPILFASAMAANTLLIDWVDRGEQPEAAVRRYLSRVQAQHGATTTFFVSEASRRYYHPTGVLKTVSPGSAQDAWFFRLRASSSPYEVNLDRDTADLSRTTVFVNYKLLGDGGRFLGAVGLGRSTSQLNRRIQQAERTNGIQVMFLDDRGRILLSPRRGQAPPPPLLQRAIGQQRLRDGFRDQARNTFQFRQGGELIYVRTKRIPELNWTLVVSQPVRVPSGPLWSSLLQISVTALLTLILALLLVFRLTDGHHHKLAWLAHTDPLTGLWNRRQLDERVRSELDRADRYGDELALVLFDIDHFKAINDRFGHAAGDRVLVELAGRVRAQLRESDGLGRWGGEEFLVLMPHSTDKEAHQLAEKLRGLVAGTPIEGVGTVTASFGVVQRRPLESAESWFRRVDDELYRAKQAGRNRVMVG